MSPPPRTTFSRRITLAAIVTIATAMTSGAAAQPAPADSEERIADNLARAAELIALGNDRPAVDLLRSIATARPELAQPRLLLAIAYYHLNRYDEAEPLLATLQSDSDARVRESALAFLALIEVARGAVDAGRAHLASLDRGGALASSSQPLFDRLRPPRLEASLLVEPGFDSNAGRIANLSQAPALTSTADGYFLLVAGLGVRPLRRVAWTIDNLLSYRLFFSQRTYDYLFDQLGTRYAWSSTRHRIIAELALVTQVLAGSPFAIGPATFLRYRARLWEGLALTLDYNFRYNHMLSSSYLFLGGHEHWGAIELSWGNAAQRWELGVGYRPSGQIADDAAFSYHGHSANLRARIRHRFFEATAWVRGGASFYREGRRDRYAGGELDLAFSLRREVAIVVDASLWRNQSNVDAFSYWKGTVGVGVVANYAGL